MKKLTETEDKIKRIFSENPSPKEVKKAKRLAMKYNIKLGSLRKKFCKKCYSMKLKVKGIKKGIKTIECQNCKKVMRWKVKN